MATANTYSKFRTILTCVFFAILRTPAAGEVIADIMNIDVCTVIAIIIMTVVLQAA